MESVRFAGTNHLCIELGYQKNIRLIEPYSLRRTRDGHLLLYAIKVQTGELRSYRVDRIESINVTNQPFKPRVAVEFTSSEIPVITPIRRRSPLVPTVRRRRSRSRPSGIVYIIKCFYCGKEFRRTKYDTHLNPHKQKGNRYDCPGRTGYEVDRIYN